MKYIQHVIANNTITLARACLALSVLGTLLFTPLTDLFPEHHMATLAEGRTLIGQYNIFFLFDNFYIGYGIAIVGLILVIAGFAPRFTCWLQSWITYSFFYGMLIVEGGDQLNAILTLLLIPICILDPRINAWKNKPSQEKLPSWLYWNARYAIIFIGLQMALLYLNAGAGKTFATEWYNGTAIYYWFNDNMFGAPDWLKFIINPIIQSNIGVSLLTWGVIGLEIVLFVAFFLPQQYKYRFFVVGVFFHFAIVMVHGLTSFWLAMSGGLILYLLRLDLSIADNWKLLREAIMTTISLPQKSVSISQQTAATTESMEAA